MSGRFGVFMGRFAKDVRKFGARGDNESWSCVNVGWSIGVSLEARSEYEYVVVVTQALSMGFQRLGLL